MRRRRSETAEEATAAEGVNRTKRTAREKAAVGQKLLANTAECAKMTDALLAEAERVDRIAMHTPAYTNEQYRVARDLYYWTCGQANRYPAEWAEFNTALQKPATGDLLLLQALSIQAGLPPPRPRPTYDEHRFAEMERDAAAFAARGHISRAASVPATLFGQAGVNSLAQMLLREDKTAAGADAEADNGNTTATTTPNKKGANAHAGGDADSTPRAYSSMEAAVTTTPQGAVVHAEPEIRFEPGAIPVQMKTRFPWLKRISELLAKQKKRTGGTKRKAAASKAPTASKKAAGATPLFPQRQLDTVDGYSPSPAPAPVATPDPVPAPTAVRRTSTRVAGTRANPVEVEVDDADMDVDDTEYVG